MIRIALCFCILILLPCQAVAELKVGIVPRYSAEITEELFTPFVEGLEKTLNEPVKLIISPTMKSFYKGYSSGSFDLVHLPHPLYVKFRKQGKYQLICANVEDGQEKKVGALLVRRDSGIDTIEQLRGKTVSLCDSKLAMGCRVAPLFLMVNAGLKPGKDFTLHDGGSGTAAVADIVYKRADAACSCTDIMKMSQAEREMNLGELKVLAETEPYPQLPWTILASTDKKKAETIKSWMLGLDTTPDGRAILEQAHIDRFIAAQDADYDYVHRMLQAVSKK